MNERKLLGNSWSTIEDRKEEFAGMGGIRKIIECITDAPCDDYLEEKINVEQLTNAINSIREHFAEALEIAECPECGELHKIEDMFVEPDTNNLLCNDCAKREYGTCLRCGNIRHNHGWLCDECAEDYDYCEHCCSVHKKEEFNNIKYLKEFNFKHRGFSGFVLQHACSECCNNILKHNNQLTNNIQCRVYIFNELEEIKFASKENSTHLIYKHATKNGRPIHYLYSSLISKEENKECLRYFVNYASSKAIQHIVSQDKEIIIELIGQEDFLTIFKGNL